jgi:hypothetical protein
MASFWTRSIAARAMRTVCGAVIACAACGCGGSDDATAPGTSGEWRTLLTGDWTLPQGDEGYVCVRQTVTEDIYIRSFDAINPPGTHHTFLTMGPPSGPDGVTRCQAAEIHGTSVYGSGVGTNRIEFPEGVAMKVEAGSQLLLNLHLFNSTGGELSGTSGAKGLTIDESEVETIGQAITAGTLDLNIPPQQETSKASSCALPADATLFAVLPHMHQLGIHMKVSVSSSIDGERVLHDGPYDFEQQLYYPIDPIRVAQGDQVNLECTWRNTTDRPVAFGDSSLDEMCFVGLYRYPAQGVGRCIGR